MSQSQHERRVDERLLCLVDFAAEKNHNINFRSILKMMESGITLEDINRRKTPDEIWPNFVTRRKVKFLLYNMTQQEIDSLQGRTSLYHLVLIDGGVTEHVVKSILIPARIRFADLNDMTFEKFTERIGGVAKLSIYKRVMSAYVAYIRRHEGRRVNQSNESSSDENPAKAMDDTYDEGLKMTPVKHMDGRLLCLVDIAIEKGHNVNFRSMSKMMNSGVVFEEINRKASRREIWTNTTIKKSVKSLLADMSQEEIASLDDMTSLYHLVLIEGGVTEYIVKSILIPSRIRFENLEDMTYEIFKRRTGGMERLSVYKKVMSAYDSYVGRHRRLRYNAGGLSSERNSPSNHVRETHGKNGRVPYVRRVEKTRDRIDLKKIVRRLISVYDQIGEEESYRSWYDVAGMTEKEVMEGLRRLEKLKFISISNFDVTKQSRSLDEFMETIEDGQGKLFLKKRLSGMNTADIAKEQGKSRQRVSQVLQKVLDEIPITHIKEARRTINIFREYTVDQEFFTEVLLEKKETFHLLKLKCNKERIRDGVKKSKVDCLNQLLPDQRIRYLQAESLFEDENGEVVKMTKRNLMKKYFFMHGRDADSAKNHHVRYSEFLDEELHGKRSVIEEYGITLHNFESTIAESSYCIHSYDQKVRYFEVNRIAEEKANLEKLFMLPEGIYSTSFVYETNESYFRSLDIKDHHELHNVLKLMLDLDFIKIRRIPEFAIGVEDKIKWFIRLIKKLSPITLDAFIDHLEQNFGLHGPSTRTRVLTDLPEYVTPERKLIHVSAKPATIHKNFLKRILVDDIYIAQDLIDEHPILKSSGNLYLNKKMLRSVGYVLSGGFIVRKEIGSGESYYRNLLMKNQYFTLNESPLLKTRSFWKTVSELQSRLDLLQIGKNHYMNISVLEKIGIEKSDLIDFQEVVSRSFSDERYFTVKSIHERVPHKIIELGFDDIFYERLCRMHKGVRYISSATGDIFYQDEHVRNLTDFVRDHINDGMSVDELFSSVTQKFGISLNPNKTIEKIRMTGAHYVPETRRIHFDKRDFFEQLYAGARKR